MKVCDFGLSRFEEELQEEMNPVGTVRCLLLLSIGVRVDR